MKFKLAVFLFLVLSLVKASAQPVVVQFETNSMSATYQTAASRRCEMTNANHATVLLIKSTRNLGK